MKCGISPFTKDLPTPDRKAAADVETAAGGHGFGLSQGAPRMLADFLAPSAATNENEIE